MTRLDLRKQRKIVISGNPGISFLWLRNKSDMPEVLYTLKSKKTSLIEKLDQFAEKITLILIIQRFLFIDTQNLFLCIFLTSLSNFFRLNVWNSYLVQTAVIHLVLPHYIFSVIFFKFRKLWSNFNGSLIFVERALDDFKQLCCKKLKCLVKNPTVKEILSVNDVMSKSL